MAWKEVERNVVDIAKHKNEPYMGIFLGRENIETKFGQQSIWKFEAEDGSRFGIYGFTNLDSAMDSVAEGRSCRITYLGKEKVKTQKRGNVECHQVKVEVDDTEEPETPPDDPGKLEPF
jgi:hypothetical protein